MASVTGKVKKGVMEWSDDFQAQRIDDKQKVEGSWSYNCHIDDIFKFQPATGAACVKKGYEFLTVSSLDIVEIKGVVVTANVKFNGYPEGEGFEFGGRDSKYKWDDSVSTKEEPIGTHPKFKDIGAERFIIKKYQSGEYSRDAADQFKFGPSELQEGDQAFSVSVTSDAGKKLLEYVDNGVENWLKPSVTRRITWESKTEPTTPNTVGKIGNPRRGKDIDGIVNWLFIGFAVSLVQGNIYTASEEWLGGDWDTWLYGDAA